MEILQHWTPLPNAVKKNAPSINEVVTLPVFPEFKKLTLDDRHIIEEFVKDHPPYSDFNFTSLWCWNTNDTTMYSILYDNLVIQMQDYTSGKTIFTFIGKNEPVLTTDRLLNYAENFGVTELSLIPEVTHNELQKHDHAFEVVEDRDNFDYIYEIAGFIKMQGGEFQKKRQLRRKFERENSWKLELVTEISVETELEMINLFDTWVKNKDLDGSIFRNELCALRKCLLLTKMHDLDTFLLYVDGKLNGFAICEVINDEYVIGHFAKFSTTYKGIWEFLLLKMNEYYHTSKIRYFNQQQDLGIDLLRKSKEQNNHLDFLKKFKFTKRVTLDNI